MTLGGRRGGGLCPLDVRVLTLQHDFLLPRRSPAAFVPSKIQANRKTARHKLPQRRHRVLPHPRRIVNRNAAHHRRRRLLRAQGTPASTTARACLLSVTHNSRKLCPCSSNLSSCARRASPPPQVFEARPLKLPCIVLSGDTASRDAHASSSPAACAPRTWSTSHEVVSATAAVPPHGSALFFTTHVKQRMLQVRCLPAAPSVVVCVRATPPCRRHLSRVFAARHPAK